MFWFVMIIDWDSGNVREFLLGVDPLELVVSMIKERSNWND
jgi:hypothetical protein